MILSLLSAYAAGSVSVTEYPLSAARSPYQITTGPDGNLWFTEQAGYIGRITISGVVTEFPTPTSGSNPVAITTGPDGNLWFCEHSTNIIGRITTAGVITEFAAAGNPLGIATGPDGALWFTEQTSGKIARMTTAGAVTNEYVIPPLGNVPDPRGITVGPDGNLWFAEQVGAHVGRITTAGTITQFPTAAGAWYDTVGSDGNVWFTEPSNSMVGRVTMAGVVTEFSASASSSPMGIASGPDGDLWVAEAGISKIARMTPAGVMDAEYAVPTAGSGPWGITQGPDLAMWFTENGGSRIGQVFGIVAPTVTSVGPSIGSAAGGTAVTITGTGFAGVTSLSFGGTQVTASPCPVTPTAPCFTVVSGSQIQAITPAGQPGTQDIQVIAPGGTSVPSANDRFTLVAVASAPAAIGEVPVPVTGGGNLQWEAGATLMATGALFLMVCSRRADRDL